MTSDLERIVGTHRVRLERPDVLHVLFRGDVTVEHMDAFFALIEGMVKEGPAKRVFVLQRLTEAGTFSPQVRKLIASEPRVRLVGRVTGYGGGFAMRVMLTMVQMASKTFNPKNQVEAEFHATEAAARAWIDALRRRK